MKFRDILTVSELMYASRFRELESCSSPLILIQRVIQILFTKVRRANISLLCLLIKNLFSINEPRVFSASASLIHRKLYRKVCETWSIRRKRYKWRRLLNGVKQITTCLHVFHSFGPCKWLRVELNSLTVRKTLQVYFVSNLSAPIARVVGSLE